MHRSMIYMQLEKAVLVEGSHQRTLYIMPSLPERSRILKYGVTRFAERELGKGLESQFLQQYPEQKNRVYAITHNGSWHAKAIEALRKLGVKFEVEPLLTAKTYREFRRGHRV